MNRYLHLLSLLCAALLVACQGSSGTATLTTDQPVTTPLEQRFLGQMAMRGNGVVLTLCGQKKMHLVSFEPKAKTFIDPFIVKGAQNFFIDAWGTVQPDARVHITRVERIHADRVDCEENPSNFLFKARGNEPFWALIISHNNIRFERPEATPYDAPYSLVHEANGARHFRTETEGGVLEVTLEPKPCRDGMADAQLAWTAQVHFDEKLWKGCAYSGIQME